MKKKSSVIIHKKKHSEKQLIEFIDEDNSKKSEMQNESQRNVNSKEENSGRARER